MGGGGRGEVTWGQVERGRGGASGEISVIVYQERNSE